MSDLRTQHHGWNETSPWFALRLIAGRSRAHDGVSLDILEFEPIISSMGHGGRRNGAGKKKGSKHAPTLVKESYEAGFKAYMEAQKTRLRLSQLEAAAGASVLMVQTEKGPMQITDEKQIFDVMRMPCEVAGKPYWWIQQKAPDARLLVDINDRIMGKPKQVNEVIGSGGGPVIVNITHKYEP
jgi:hypothetical protein